MLFLCSALFFLPIFQLSQASPVQNYWGETSSDLTIHQHGPRPNPDDPAVTYGDYGDCLRFRRPEDTEPWREQGYSTCYAIGNSFWGSCEMIPQGSDCCISEASELFCLKTPDLRPQEEESDDEEDED